MSRKMMQIIAFALLWIGAIGACITDDPINSYDLDFTTGLIILVILNKDQ